MPSGRMLFFIGSNRNPTLAETDDLPGANFAGLAQFNLTVDAHFAARDQNLSGAAAGAQPHEFKKLIELDEFCAELKLDLFHYFKLRFRQRALFQ